MTRKTASPTLSLAVLAAAGLIAGAALPAAAQEHADIPRLNWSFAGMFGGFEKNQLQRGFQVYKEVCSNCHALSRIAFRNLAEKGGPEFPIDGVRSLAATYKVTDGPNDDGKMYQRPGRLSDTIPPPYKNEQEARSIQNGAYPPDLSLIAKARNVEYTGPLWFHPISMLRDIVTGYQEGGVNYIHAVLTGYREDAPAYRKEPNGRLTHIADSEVRDPKAVLRCASVERGEEGKPDTCNPMGDLMHYNEAFPGHQIAMIQPIRDGQVTFGDGTKPTLDNYAEDVTSFLAWAADPTLMERKRMGWQVLLYLMVTAVLLYFAKRKIWSDVH